MDIKELISSGIIERFVLGLASDNERNELLRMRELYPEVDKAITDYEENLEEYTKLHAVKPPEDIKNNILAAVGSHKGKDEEPKTPSPKTVYGIHKLRRWKRIAVAAIILLVISLGVNIFYLPKYEEYKDRYNFLVADQQKILVQNKVIKTRLEKVQGSLNILTNPNLKTIKMEGVNTHKEGSAIAFWNTKTRQSYLGKLNLPKPPKGKTYQLWAIVDGKPESLGLYNPAKEKGIKTMKKVLPGEIQAFAITLEKAGGSLQPTMDQMYVLGSVS